MIESSKCERCRQEFPSRDGKKFCSEPCRKKDEKRRAVARKRAQETLRCEQCNKLIVGRRRKYCSSRCLHATYDRKRVARTTPTGCACRDCGVVEGMGWWVGRMKHPGSAGTRCHPCYLTYTRKRQTPNPRPLNPQCLSCRKPVTAGDARCRVCFPLTCTQCGAAADKQASTPTCRSCAQQKRTSAEQRRRGAERNGDKGITWRKVAECNGWACHLCGEPVKQVAGTAHEPKGATVDHIIPIALGGPHTWDNVALAHRRCNTARGASPIAV